MAYKSIVAVASGRASDAQLFNAAARLAWQCGALVRVLPAYPDPAANLVYFGAALKGLPETAAERLREGEREQQRQLETRIAEAAARAGVSAQKAASGACIYADKRALMPAVAIAEAAVIADLVMFAGDAARDAFVLGAPFAETLLGARAPVLLVRDDGFGPGAVAVAWDGSAQAGGAARAATPLLRLAEEVVILQNVSDLNTQARTPAPPEVLSEYLARHEVKRIRTVTVEGDNVAASLLRAAHGARCSTLVAGAYGRPRLYEWALGGTTRALVNAPDRLHLLLAH